jgi:tetratricopeptide (TPR) repeat protein
MIQDNQNTGRSTRRSMVLIGLIALVLTMLTPPASAWQSSRQVKLSEVDRKIRDASTKLRNGKYSEVIIELEVLYAERPGDTRVIFVLGDAYVRTDQSAKAIAILEKEIKRSGGRNQQLWTRLANAYQHEGDGAGMIETLLRGLKKNVNWMRQFDDLVEIAVNDSIMGSDAFSYLREQAYDKKAPTVWREALSHASLVKGEYGEALATLMAIDSERHSGGVRVMKLAKTLSQRDLPELALAAFDSVLAISKSDRVKEEAWFEKGQVYEQMQRFSEANTVYRTQVETFPRGLLALRADLNRAKLLKGPLNDLEAGKALYQSLVERTLDSTRKSPRALSQTIREEALLALGECALRTNGFDEAESTFVRIGREARHDLTREQAEFERAELLFYQGRFIDAEDAFYHLTDHYPIGNWVNDALARILMLGEYVRQSPTALTVYAKAQYYKRIDHPDSALAICREALADTTMTWMRDHLLTERIRLAGHLGYWTEADSLLPVLLAHRPESRLAPSTLLWLANSAEHDPERSHLAAPLYEETIIRYPNSMEAGRARINLRLLQNKLENS